MADTQQRQLRRRRNQQRRTLRVENLESRRLLAGDGMMMQNPGDPEDTNADGEVTAIDALGVVNRLNQRADRAVDSRFLTDVNGDGVPTPLDALLVINRLNNGKRYSAVTPESRGANLRKALESDRLPAHLSRPEAIEMLETLRRGGRWEIGERFRGGKMVNERDSLDKEVDDALMEDDVTDVESPMPPVEEAVDAIGEGECAVLTCGERALTDLFSSLGEDDPLYNPEWWLATLREHDRSLFHDGLEEHVRMSLAERLRHAADSERLPQWIAPDLVREIADIVETSETPLHDIRARLHDARAQLGGLREQIAQMFANVDVDAILEQIRVDLATLVEARSGADGHTEHDSVFAEFVRGAAMSMF